MEFSEAELTCDRFLGGRLQIWQPRAGYRAGVDPVLLAAMVTARAGDSVLDLGCGVGVASLCLAARVPGVVLSGVELQAGYGALARRNAAENGVEMDVHITDLRALPAPLRTRNFDHVILNPPYYFAARRSPTANPGRETALAGQTPLRDWIDVASRRLKPRGHLWVIQDAARLADLLRACDARLGSLEITPLAGRQGRAAHLVLLRARKGGRAPLRLRAPIVMHDGPAHDGDRESYSPELRAVLRDGAALS